MGKYKFAKLNKKLDLVLKFGVALLLTAIPLYPKFPIVNVPGTYVAVRLEDFLIAIVVGLWIIRYRFKIIKFFHFQVSKSILLFWVAGFLSLLSALLITQTIVPHIGLMHALRRVEYMILFLVVFSTVRTKDDLRFYVEVILLTTFLVFVYAVGQKFLSWPIISTMNQEYSKGIALNIISGGRINSTFAGHYDLAAFTVLLLNFEAAIIVAAKNWKFRLWVILVTVATFWMLLMSASRISFAAYLGSIVITLVLLHKKIWVVPVLLVSILLSSLAPSLFNRYAEVVKYEFAPRFASLDFWSSGETGTTTSIASATPVTPTPTLKPKTSGGTKGVVKPSGPKPTPTPTRGPRTPRYAGNVVIIPEDRSTAIRFKVEWPRAMRAFSKNPLLGTGYSSITLATDNDFLRLLGEAGAIGLTAFGLIFLSVFAYVKRYLFKGPRNLAFAIVIGVIGATIGFMANAVFIDVFEASKVATFYWMLLAVMIGAVKILNNNYSKKLKRKK